MIKLFLNIHFIKKHPSKVKFSVSKCNNFKMQGKFFFEIRQNVTELQISKVTRIFEFHLKATFSENTQTNTFLKTIKVRVKSVSRTPTLPVVFFPQGFDQSTPKIFEFTLRKAFQRKSTQYVELSIVFHQVEPNLNIQDNRQVNNTIIGTAV